MPGAKMSEVDSIEENRGRRLVEFYSCPFCGKVSFDVYTLKAPWDTYMCNAQCRHCCKFVHSVDSPDRCGKCGKQLACLYEERPLCTIFAISLTDLNGIDCRSLSAKLTEQMKRLAG